MIPIIKNNMYQKFNEKALENIQFFAKKSFYAQLLTLIH